MNILHVCHNYFPSPGGPQYTMRHISEKLVAFYGDKVEVVTSNSFYGPESILFKKITPKREIINGVTVHRKQLIRWHYSLIKYGGKIYAKLFKNSLPHFITKWRWELHSPTLIKAMNNSKADVVMATTINYMFCDYPFWRFRTKNPKPFVLYGALHLHNELQENNIGLLRAKACDCYIANTEFEAEKLIGYGISAEKIVTIGTGIELKEFLCSTDELTVFRSKYSIEKDDILIGHVGRLSKGKGVSLLIDAYRQLYLQNKKVKLLLAGSSTELIPEIQKIIQQENLPIIIIENFQNELKPVIFNALDIFVLASQSESFGVVFLEAWACKKPVIATRSGATSSLLSDYSDSLLFEAGNPDSLFQKLDYLISAPEMQNKFGENGYNKVLNNFTWEKIVAEYRKAEIKGIENFNKAFKHFSEINQ